MKATWNSIDTWLKANAPMAHASLRPGASTQALEELDRRLGFTVPAQLRDHLSIHDGQEPDTLLGLLDGWIFLGSESIAEAHDTFTGLLNSGDFDGRPTRSRDGLAKACWWSARWIPILEGPGGDYLVVDMDPSENGDDGQIVTFWHADGDRKVKAESLELLLEQFLEDLEADEYELSRNGGLRRA